MKCCTPSSNTPTRRSRWLFMALLCAGVLAMAFLMQSRVDAVSSNWTWLIALLCPALHLFMCYRLHRAGPQTQAVPAGEDGKGPAGH